MTGVSQFAADNSTEEIWREMPIGARVRVLLIEVGASAAGLHWNGRDAVFKANTSYTLDDLGEMPSDATIECAGVCTVTVFWSECP